jgi:hypothetical protein
MADWHIKTPVALIIFNRPDTTQRVFETIRQAKPPLLLVVADGPREEKPGEAEKCAAARAIIEGVDWDCEVLKNYSEINLGCRRRVASGLDWVFDTVEETIVLEDDCVPHPTFFRFCEELLDRYRHDRRIMSISGQNVQFGRRRTEYSYYFSRYTHCWGWASWRRAWQHYDLDMKLWSEVRDGNFLSDILEDPKAVKDWTRTFQLTYEEKLNTWDFQWTFACWLQSGLSILSNVNLVSNIGHGRAGTHTSDVSSPYSNMPVEAMTFPLKHPPFVIRDSQADNFTQDTHYDYNPRFLKLVKNKLKKLLNIPIKYG